MNTQQSHAQQPADQAQVAPETGKKSPDLKGDFARGERTQPPESTEPDFARGERTQPQDTTVEPDFARGERTQPAEPTEPDFARGQREEEA